MPEKCLMSRLLSEVPELASFVDRTGDVGVAIWAQTQASNIAGVSWKVRRFLIRFQIPDATVCKIADEIAFSQLI